MRTVLVVDDERGVVDIITHYLSGSGYNVLAEDSFERAQQLIASLEQLDAAIIDFWLEDTTSLALIEELANRFPNISLIMISGGRPDFPIETSHALSRLSGANSFVQKPFKREELMSVLDKHFS